MALVDQFLADQNGKAMDFDGMYGAQCVDSVAFYVRDYLKLPVFRADAARWYNDFDSSPLVGHFTKIQNTVEALPLRGDIIVWDGSLANSGGAGHIAIVLDANNNSFTSVDQNWAGMYVHQVTHNWSKVIGWLRPSQGEEMITKDDIGLLRIGHSEVGNWDSASVHSGLHDQQFLNAWQGKSVKDFIWAQWNNGQPHRINQNVVDSIVNQLNEANTRPTKQDLASVNARVDELGKAITVKDNALQAAQKQIESLKAQVGDNSKWEVFKALIRELLVR